MARMSDKAIGDAGRVEHSEIYGLSYSDNSECEWGVQGTLGAVHANGHGESPPQIMKRSYRPVRFPHPSPLPEGEGNAATLRVVSR